LSSYVRTANTKIEASIFDQASLIEQDIETTTQPTKEQKQQFSLRSHNKNIDHVLQEFSSPQEVIENQKIPPIITITFLAITAFFLTFILWSSLSIVDTTISARGRLTTTVPTIKIRAPNNAAVKTVHIHSGQQVAKEAPLITMDETFINADLARANIELTQLTARIQRLTAEINQKNQDAATTIKHPIERKVFLSRIREYQFNISAMDHKIANLKQQRTITQDDIKLAKQQMLIKKALVDAHQERHSKKLYIETKLKFLNAKDQYVTTKRAYQQLLTRIIKIENDIKSTHAKRQAFISEWLSEIGRKLSQTAKERDKLQKEHDKLIHQKENITIPAPVDGVIVETENLFPGARIQAGQTIISLVPSNVPLNAELDIDPRDIGNLIIGAKVSIKLDALPYQKHGDLAGEISFISEDTVNQSTDQKKGTFYRARATITDHRLRNLPHKARLIPGMQITGDILAGQRRLITYFIYPVIRTIQTSFTEPGQ
ncbi:HlyD family type I secretion periplasmic adaptor subunit, partial [Magnetococcales bacterium HHB-1]